MIFPPHFTQEQRARRALEVMQTELDECVRAIGAILAGAPTTGEGNPVESLKAHMTSDGYGLRFTGFDEVRCPSCGAPTWSLKFNRDGDCPVCELARFEEQESRQDWNDHLAELADTAAFEGGDD